MTSPRSGHRPGASREEVASIAAVVSPAPAAEASETGADPATPRPPAPGDHPAPGARTGQGSHPDDRAHTAAIVAEGLTRRFDDVTAVSDVSFEVPEGSILGVIGPSGSGKTTTIRMLMGSLAPSEGSVVVLGHDPLHFDHGTRERIGYMPQQFILYPDLTAGENVDFVASLFGLLFFRRRRRVRQVLQLLELWDARKRQAKDLSGGMQRRLELACALVHEPRLLILDEPTAGIDPILRRTIWDELHRLRGEGVTCLVTTQYVTEAEECDTVALISEGRLIAYASPADIRRQAYGGDIVEISTEATFDADVLAAMPGVHGIRQTGLRDFRVAVRDAAVAMPELVDAVAAAGGTVAAAREARTSFEEVFAELVERDRREHPVEATDEDGEAAPAASRTDAERAETATEAGLRGPDPAGGTPVEPAMSLRATSKSPADAAAGDAVPLRTRDDREEVA